MQVSTIFLNYPSASEVNVMKAVTIFGDTCCEVSHHTFDDLISERRKSGFRCLIVRVKDVAGKVHLFEGCAADALEIFRNKGYFTINSNVTACATIQLFELKLTQHNAHSYYLKTCDNYIEQHAEAAWSQKNGHVRDLALAKMWYEKLVRFEPNNKRAHQILGQIYREHAKGCFAKVLELEPNNVFALSSQKELDEVEEVRKDLENLEVSQKSPQEEAPQQNPPQPEEEKTERKQCSCLLQ